MNGSWAPPEAFCWSKMGPEAGEGLGAILQRKEWERQAGRGQFFWGIGNSLGDAVHLLAERVQAPQVLFSSIRGRPRSSDVKPEAVRLWMTYLDTQGKEVALPWYAWVTSRAGHDMRTSPHYALVCKSSRELQLEANGPELQFDRLRNLTTGRKLGFSQVTAVVENLASGTHETGLLYPVALRANLAEPFYVRLHKGVTLSVESLNQQAQLERRGQLALWLEWVRAAKQDAWKLLSDSSESSLELQLPLRF